MEMELLCGKMEKNILESFGKMKLTDTVCIFGRVGKSMLENEKKGKCMDRECLCGKMAGSMKGSISVIKKKDMEFLLGLMGKSIKETDCRGSSMVKEQSDFLMESLTLETG